MPTHGLVLFAHGARDVRWAEPFAAVAAALRARRPDLAVSLAFLDHLEPDLATAVQALAALGVQHLRVVPLFFGRGGHLRDDFPEVLRHARDAAPQVAIELIAAAGEDPRIQAALADFALRGLEP